MLDEDRGQLLRYVLERKEEFIDGFNNQSFIDKVRRIVADMNIQNGTSVILGLCNRESFANISDDTFFICVPQ